MHFSHHPVNSDNVGSITDCDNGRNSATGIFAIPPEILSTIFEMGKNMTDFDYWEGDEKPKAAFEVVASHTCLLFRNVALSTPKLWTSIQVNERCSIEWVSGCITRSAACWLDVSIELQLTDARDKALDALMDLIMAQSLRWRTLSVKCRVNRLTLTRICDSPAPGLQHLSLEVVDVEQADAHAVNGDIRIPHIFKDGTQKLKFVRLRGLAIHLFRPQLDAVVILHLDHTKFIPLSYITFRSIITRSSLLTHLSVYGDIIGNAPWPGQTNVIHLPTLLSLRIYGAGGQIYSGLLLGIEAPLLKSLTVKDLKEHDFDPLWDLTDAARYKNLRQLVFCDFEVSRSTYEHIFYTFPEITSFSALYSSIAESPVIDLLIDGMIQGQYGPFVPWPRLEILSFSFDDDEAEEEIIRQLVEVRKNSGSPLSKFLLKYHPEEEAPRSIDLENGTVVEFSSRLEPWPPISTHFDYDDILF